MKKIWILNPKNAKTLQIQKELISRGWKTQGTLPSGMILSTFWEKGNNLSSIFISDETVGFRDDGTDTLEHLLFPKSKKKHQVSDESFPVLNLPFQHLSDFVSLSTTWISSIPSVIYESTVDSKQFPVTSTAYFSFDSFSFHELDTFSLSIVKAIDPVYVKQFLKMKLWTCATWFLLSCSSDSLHWTLLEKTQKLYPSFTCEISTPCLQTQLDIPFIQDPMLRFKELVVLSSGTVPTKKYTLMYKETWLEDTLPAHVPYPIFITPQECIVLHVLISPSSDVLSCTFSMNQSNGPLKDIDLSHLTQNFATSLNSFYTESAKKHE